MAVIVHRKFRKGAIVAGLAIWGLAVSGAIACLMKWEFTPGPQQAWSGPAPIKGNRWRLLMVAHTECPCTAASLEELRDVLRRSGPPLEATVVFTGPDATPTSDAANVKYAQSIPYLHIEFCKESEAVTSYNAHVSGQTFLFDPRGRVRFSGGLTTTRGEAGPSVGVDAIVRILGGSDETRNAPVLGCALETPEKNP